MNLTDQAYHKIANVCLCPIPNSRPIIKDKNPISGTNNRNLHVGSYAHQDGHRSSH